MNIYTKKSALAVAAAVFAIAAMPAQADHFDTGVVYDATGNVVEVTCASFGGLKYTLDNEVTFATDNRDFRDRTGLDGKLNEAHDKLHEDPPKNCDAAQKLDDFNTRVVKLRAGNTGDKLKIAESHEGAIQCLIDGSAALAAELRTGVTCGDAGTPPRGKGPK